MIFPRGPGLRGIFILSRSISCDRAGLSQSFQTQFSMSLNLLRVCYFMAFMDFDLCSDLIFYLLQ
jgi:hypothetical protein